MQIRWQVQFVQEARHFSQVQVGNVFCLAMLNHLANVSIALERVGEIQPISAPNDMPRSRDNGHVCASVQWAGSVSVGLRYHSTAFDLACVNN
jgi:hypothetical protein